MSWINVMCVLVVTCSGQRVGNVQWGAMSRHPLQYTWEVITMIKTELKFTNNLMTMWGMFTDTWTYMKALNMAATIQENIKDQLKLMEDAELRQASVKKSMAENVPLLHMMYGALNEMFDLQAELLVTEAVPVKEMEPYDSVKDLLNDYAIYVGTQISDSYRDGEEIGVDMVEPHGYLEATQDMCGISYDLAYEFLRAFNMSTEEIKDALLKLDLHE